MKKDLRGDPEADGIRDNSKVSLRTLKVDTGHLLVFSQEGILVIYWRNKCLFDRTWRHPTK